MLSGEKEELDGLHDFSRLMSIVLCSGFCSVRCFGDVLPKHLWYRAYRCTLLVE
jgi:hypothetical protein